MSRAVAVLGASGDMFSATSTAAQLQLRGSRRAVMRQMTSAAVQAHAGPQLSSRRAVAHHQTFTRRTPSPSPVEVLCAAAPPCSPFCNSARQPAGLGSRHVTLVDSSALRTSRHVKARAFPPLAMVNVDFASPSLVLGVTLIGCGIALLQVRNMQREVSRDADIVVAAMISIVGSTLIFQGWRLDPLLLLCQALTTSVAFWYGLETFKLRAEVVQEETQDGDLPSQQLPPLSDQLSGVQQPDFPAARSGFLPPTADRPAAPWAPQQQQQQGMYGAGARWGLPPAGQQAMPYDAYVARGGEPMSDASYVGYQQELASSGQQQYMPPGPSYSRSGEAGSDAMYQQYEQGQLPPMQHQQQPAQYQWQPGVYGPPQGPGSSPPQQGWFDGAAPPGGADYAAGQQRIQQQQPQLQQPYSSPADQIDPYLAGVVPGVGPGPAADGMYSSDPRLSLPPASGQQQQQRQGQQQQQRQLQGGSQRAYEQVDDWE